MPFIEETLVVRRRSPPTILQCSVHCMIGKKMHHPAAQFTWDSYGLVCNVNVNKKCSGLTSAKARKNVPVSLASNFFQGDGK